VLCELNYYLFTLLSRSARLRGEVCATEIFEQGDTLYLRFTRARDLTRNYVGKNFRRPHDKY